MTAHAERRFTILVADYLARALPPEILWSHFPAGENRTAATGALLKRMGLKQGWPDFVFVLRGGKAARPTLFLNQCSHTTSHPRRYAPDVGILQHP